MRKESPPFRQDDVGVVPGEQRAQALQEVFGPVPVEEDGLPLGRGLQEAPAAVVGDDRVSLQAEVDRGKGRELVVKVPGRIFGCDRLDDSPCVLHGATGEGEEAGLIEVELFEGDIHVEQFHPWDGCDEAHDGGEVGGRG